MDLDGQHKVMDERSGAERIADERRRQLEVERYTSARDDRYKRGQLAMAAACYACPTELFEVRKSGNSVTFQDPWPFDGCDKRPYREGSVDRRGQSLVERVRELEKAGALVAAEIDRLLRKHARQLGEDRE